ncbi:MAG: cytochrome c biogenesis CcdA family protein [bacterium]
MRKGTRVDPAGFAFALAGLGAGLALVGSTKTLYLAQGQLATAVSWLPVGYAFAAGMVAAVNPCGILLLPSLAAYALATPDTLVRTGPGRATRALALGAVSTVGFVVLFGAAGVVLGAGGRALARFFPYGGLLVGAGLATLGLWLTLSGREFGLAGATRVWERARLAPRVLSFFLFGVAYGVCSLACTLPVFLAVVGTALAADSLLAASWRFLGYALGMGTVLTVALVGVSLFEATVMRWVRAVVPHVHRLAAAFLVAAGVYTVGYWWRAL